MAQPFRWVFLSRSPTVGAPSLRFLQGRAAMLPVPFSFNVWATKKRVENLRYVHRNPVKRGLVESPEQWCWSSYRFYLSHEAGAVRVNESLGEISFRDYLA